MSKKSKDVCYCILKQEDVYYPAKILNKNVDNGKTYCQIHFLGFPPKYNDWVNEDKISYNDSVLDSKKKKKKTESSESIIKMEISPSGVVLPNSLKEILKKDGSYIHKHKEYHLPRDLTIQVILQDFALEYQDELESYKYFSLGIESYFNNVVGKTLLYKNEKTQYTTLETKNAIPSTQYGIEHLLRLLTKFPRYLEGNVGPLGQDVIFQMTLDLLRFLEKRSSFY